LKSFHRGWRLQIVDVSTRFAHGARGADFRQGVMETVEELNDEGDLRLLDVVTTVRESVRLSSKLVRTSAVAVIFAATSFFAVIDIVDVHRDNVIAQNRVQLLRYLSLVPRPRVILTSAELGRSCLELDKQVNLAKSTEIRPNFHMVSISFKFYCYPSNLLSMK